MKKRVKIMLLLVFLANALTFFSQEIKVLAVLDSSKIRIGEQVKLDLYFTYSNNSDLKSIEWPAIGDTLSEKVEVISVTPIDTTIPDKSNSNYIQQHQQLVISAYDSGYFVIPPFKFIINKDTANPRYSEALLLEVHTVPTDSSITKTKDIKPPFNEPFNWKWYKNYLYYGLAAVLFVTILTWLIIRHNKKKANQIFEPEKPKVPAHITALEKLESIKHKAIWKDGKYKEYYSEIADTIREYLEGRYDISALESTTDEILTLMRSQVIDNVSKDKLKQILVLSDFVKFAKVIPVEQEHEITLANAFDFVNGTKREDENMELTDNREVSN